MTRKLLVAVAVVLSSSMPVTRAQQTVAPSVDVFKSATCGCCGKWVEHMRKAGFTVHVTDLSESELKQIKARYGVPESARSCHTARVGGFTVEGHAPADVVKRLLKEKPRVEGIAVPGMPIGSPGMESAGVQPQPYQVLTFDKQGATKVFSTQKP